MKKTFSSKLKLNRETVCALELQRVSGGLTLTCFITQYVSCPVCTVTRQNIC